MKIACIIHSLCGGGAERVMAGLASRLTARQHDVTLITLDDGNGDRHDVDRRVIRRPLDVLSDGGNLLTRIRNTSRRVNRIRDAIDQVAPEVVLSFCDHTNVLTLLATEPLQIPVVVSERSDPSQQKLGSGLETLRKQKYKNAQAIVVQTESSAEYLDRYIGRPAIVIPSAVDSPPILSDRTAAQSNRRIVGLGRLEHEKGFDRLINAFAAVNDQTSAAADWSLRVIGEGSLRRQLEDQIRSTGLSGQITMPGWIRPVWDELAAATIFVLPSRYEGFPSALLEAMGVGVPSIAVDCPSGPSAIVQDGIDGLLIANNDTALANALQQLMFDSPVRERLGEASKQVVQRFGWDAMVDAYEQVLESVPRRSES